MSDSIKVAIKVRPLIKREEDEGLPIQWTTRDNTIVSVDPEMRKRGDGGFTFDCVFDMNTRNKDVFDSIVKPIVEAAANGYNGTVFAYGQTSSGKTYTMMGSSEEPGTIPLAVEDMFETINNIPGREFLLRVSYLEIYKEKVHDLLTKEKKDLKIHEDSNGQPFVHCKEEVTNCPQNVLSIMNKGNKNRQIGETNMNERSSRSHTIFRIIIESREVGAGSDGTVQVSQLNMVDLAGSEKLSQTGATGERFKEGLHINLSLSTLALVIKQLSESQDPQKYVNFRDSKLTRLLQASLGGNAMTAIICAVTPAAIDETQCTLSFASRARNVKTKPKLNEITSDGVLLKRYAKQIDKLNAELKRVKELTPADFEEMKLQMQEKDQMNKNLEERILLLQTRIVHGDNHNNSESFKVKEKRRQTWGGTVGYKLNTSLPSWNLSPIKEMSPCESFSRKSVDVLNTSFQIAFADFELELLESQKNYNDGNDSEEDVFITYRKHNRVKFKDDIIMHEPYRDSAICNTTTEKTDAFTQTTSLQSPGTPKQALREKILYLAKEYSQLQEFTTLEKQLHIDDATCELKKKVEKSLTLEKQLENVTSDKEAFEHIASELRKKLTAAELRYVSAEDQLNAQVAELQKIPDLEKKNAQLSAQKVEMQNVPELQKQVASLTAEKDGYEHVASELRKKLIEVEQQNIILKDKLTSQKVEYEESPLSKSENVQQVNIETESTIVSENVELQRQITDLQNKLTEAELSNSSMKDKLNEQQETLKDLQDLKELVDCLTLEKNKYVRIVDEMQNQLCEVEEANHLIRNKLNEQELYVQKTRDLEKQIEDLAVKKNEFGIKEEFNAQQMELQEIIDEQKKCIENFALERSKLEDTICELQEKAKKAELDNNLMKDKINEQELQLQTSHDLRKEIEDLTLKTKESESTIHELQEKLAKAEDYTSAENEQQLREIQELETQVVKLTSENEGYERIPMRSHSQSIESSEKKSAGDYSNEDRLKDQIKDLQGIIQDIQRENTHLKEQVLARSTTSDVEQCNHENTLLSNGDSSRILEELSITRMSLDEDSARLSADLVLKNQELDEIKHIVQSLKADIENLQKTIYLLTTENSELANKLSAERECAEKSAADLQQTIDDLYARNSKITDEKFNLENNFKCVNEEVVALRSRVRDVSLSEEQIISKYEEQISALTAKNTELLSNIADRMKELDTLKESKSLLYEHDCIHKDKLTDLMEKHKYLLAENNELSTDLMDKIEESDGLKQECDILKSKLELSLKNKKDIGDNDVEALKAENTLLKTEMMEMKANVKVLTEENSKMSNQLVETLEDLDNTRKINNDLHSSSLLNNTLMMNDTMDKTTKEDSAEAKVLNLQEQVNHLTRLNRKLSDLKLATCTECVHLKELSESRRLLRLEVMALSHKLEDSQRKFDRKSAQSDSLILKAKEDVNISICNASINASFSESMNVSYIEEKVQSLNSELQTLKEDHNKLSDLYKEKCNEVDELQNSTVAESAAPCDANSSKKSQSRTSRLENIEKTMTCLQDDLEKLKENAVSVKADLVKLIEERESSLLDEINTLKTANEQLLQRLSETELSRATAQEKANILDSEVMDVTKKLQELSVRYKEIESAKLLLEVETDSLKEDKLMKEQTLNELRQSLSCLQHELDLMKMQKEELNDNNNILEEEYEKKLKLLQAMNEELTNSKAVMSQNLADHSKESENKLTELNEKISKYTSENEYLKQELIKLRDIEEKFKKMKSEYEVKSQQDKSLVDDYKKLKNVLNDVSRNIIKEIKSLKPKIDTAKFSDKSIDELFQTFLQTILLKEEELAKTMKKLFEKDKQKLEDEKRQSEDAEKRMTLWTKELETEIEKLQGDLSERETAADGLQKEVARLEHLLQENNRERDALKEKISAFETDLGNVQAELNRYSKIDTVNEEAVFTAQKREKQAQETIKNKEAEFQIKLKLEKEAYNKRIEELTCTIESFKTRNMELTNTIEGLEANQKQLMNIIDLKTNELMKNNQIVHKMEIESEQCTEAFNELNHELEEKKLRIIEITELVKNKCDELTEYKANLETAVSENRLLKQQIGERKASTEQYKTEIEALRMESKKEVDAINDKLKCEELRNTELNKQLTELHNKYVALTEEINTLRDNYMELQHKRMVLEKKVRNSTSKVQAEEQIEELKDLNRSLRNNLDGASNRITELQTTKTDLMKELVILKSQHEALCKDNQELKDALSSYKLKYSDTYMNCDKYDALLQEKNKVALELEAVKVELNQKNKEIEDYANRIKELTNDKVALDNEAEELADVIREHDAENARLQDRYYTCRNEIADLKDRINDLEKKNQDLESRSTGTNVTADQVEQPHDDECSCAALKNKVRDLQLEIVTKNGKIAALELQIRSGSYPYQMKCKELQEHLSAHKNKISELKAEVKRLQTAMQRTCAKECDVCKQRQVNRRTQACQTIPQNVLRLSGKSSGVIEDDIKITKLEKEKQIMKDVCRSRSKRIKELEKHILELEASFRQKVTC